MVATMSAEQKLEAVQFWNIMSEKLQEIVNHSAADISALSSIALERDKQVSEYVEDGAGQTYHLLTSTSGTGSTMALITKYKEQPASKNKSDSSVPSKPVISKKLLPRSDKQGLMIEASKQVSMEAEKSLEVSQALAEEAVDDVLPLKSKASKSKTPPAETEGVLDCEYCQKTFTTSAQMAVHKWTHIKPYICDECGARFASKGNLIVHTRRHTGERPYTCNLCSASFSTRGNLKRHNKSHSGEKPWACQQCGARFTENKSLKVHTRKHTGERPYKCTVCPKAFAQLGILQTHMMLHLNQKAHLCDVCGKSFRQKSQLRLHKLRHNNVKRFTCSSCPAQFLTKGDMQRHKRTHTGERPFNCGLCKKTFTRQQTLTEHMNRHYGLKPYLCKYCRKAFAEMSACYKHIKTHEKESSSSGGVAGPVDGVIIDAAIVSLAQHAGTSVIIEQDPSLEVASNELVVSTTNQSEEASNKSAANQVIKKIESNMSETLNVLETRQSEFQ